MTHPISLIHSSLDVIDIKKMLINQQTGAIVIFEGCTRNNGNGERVISLTYEAFISMAIKELNLIRKEAMQKYNLNQCIIHHRLGTVPITETALIVACSSSHRREAFESIQWIVNLIKQRVPIWKYEEYIDGTKIWVENN